MALLCALLCSLSCALAGAHAFTNSARMQVNLQDLCEALFRHLCNFSFCHFWATKCSEGNWVKSQRLYHLGSDQLIFMGGGHLFRSSEFIFFGKNQAKLFIFFSTAAKLFFCEVSHVLYFLDDSLFKCKSITPLLNWFSTISTYAAKLFFFTHLRAKLFFLVKIGAKIFFSQKRWPPIKINWLLPKRGI